MSYIRSVAKAERRRAARRGDNAQQREGWRWARTLKGKTCTRTLTSELSTEDVVLALEGPAIEVDALVE